MVIPCQVQSSSKGVFDIEKIKLEEIQNYYFVDEIGNIYSTYKKSIKLISQNYDKDGYKRVSLQTKEGKRKSYRVNRLVALTFIPNPNNFPIVNHINGIKDDNRVNNLEWCTISYNTLQGYKNNNYHYIKGIKSINLINGEEKYFNSIKECATYYGIDYTNISGIVNKKEKPRKRGSIANLDFQFI